MIKIKTVHVKSFQDRAKRLKRNKFRRNKFHAVRMFDNFNDMPSHTLCGLPLDKALVKWEIIDAFCLYAKRNSDNACKKCMHNHKVVMSFLATI
jgi:hypothetical protein